jgi:hypothetical protein
MFDEWHLQYKSSIVHPPHKMVISEALTQNVWWMTLQYKISVVYPQHKIFVSEALTQNVWWMTPPI